jgi:hypothetical protein
VLGAEDEVLAVEVRCRGRDEAARAGVAGTGEPVEEVIVRLWPGRAPGGDTVTRRSGVRPCPGWDAPPRSGPAAPLALGETVVVPGHRAGQMGQKDLPVTSNIRFDIIRATSVAVDTHCRKAIQRTLRAPGEAAFALVERLTGVR